MDNSIYNLIMAGGSGTRFWPSSRDIKPKHCIGLASLVIQMGNSNGIIPVSPSNHLVGDQSLFRDDITAASFYIKKHSSV